MGLRLGKLAPKFHPKTLLMSDWLPVGGLPVPEAKRAWEYVVADVVWAASMLGNDEVGDCVIAMILHYIMAASANAGYRITFTKEQALAIYSAITGYNPSDPSTDQGTVMTDALAYWRDIGITDSNGKVHRILGWAAIDPSNLDHIKLGISIFGGVLIGTNVSQSMMDQSDAKQPWNPPYGPSIGGHGIPWLGFGRLGQTCITWGMRQQMSPQVISEADEAYVVVTQDWLDAAGVTPTGLNLDALQADLKLIAAQ